MVLLKEPRLLANAVAKTPHEGEGEDNEANEQAQKTKDQAHRHNDILKEEVLLEVFTYLKSLNVEDKTKWGAYVEQGKHGKEQSFEILVMKFAE